MLTLKIHEQKANSLNIANQFERALESTQKTSIYITMDLFQNGEAYGVKYENGIHGSSHLT